MKKPASVKSGESSDQPDAAVELLWGSPKSPTRGPKRTHSLKHLLDAAIGIADREGLQAVSMQRLAQELKFTKMAVYRYVPGRAELIALMTDRALGAPPNLGGGVGWRGQVEAWSLAVFEVFLRHPWGLQATAGPRVIGPNEAAWTELALTVLDKTGLSGSDRVDVLAVTAGHLRSMAQHAAAWQGRHETMESEMSAAYARALQGRETSFPELSRAVTESLDPVQQSNGLSFGLNCIFDGVEVRVANLKRAAGKRRKPKFGVGQGAMRRR